MATKTLACDPEMESRGRKKLYPSHDNDAGSTPRLHRKGCIDCLQGYIITVLEINNKSVNSDGINKLFRGFFKQQSDFLSCPPKNDDLDIASLLNFP